MSRPLAHWQLISLKGATHDLIKACGGVDRAAEIAGLSKLTMARSYAARDEKDAGEPSWTTLDLVSVALLEQDLAARDDPRRPVTECLARLSGRVIGDAVEAKSRSSVAAAATAVMAAFGDLSTDVMSSLSDGVVTPTEGATGDQKAARLAAALTELRTAFAGVRSSEG